MKPLLVGEDNPYGTDPRYALFPAPVNSAGARLCSLVMQLRHTEYVRLFDRVNLCAGAWSAPEARARAAALQAEAPDRKLVLLGAKVCRAFGAPYRPFTILLPTLLVLPHPSGRCRAWNEPNAFELARAVLRDFGVLPPKPLQL